MRDRIARTTSGKTYPTGTAGFFLWLRDKNPRAYGAYRSRLNTGLSGLGISPGEAAYENAATLSTATAETGAAKPSVASTISEILKQAGQAYLTTQQVKNQQKVFDLQLKRAQAGLSPLDIDMAQYGMVPTASVGLNSDTMKMVMWIAAGAGAIYLIPKLLKR